MARQIWPELVKASRKIFGDDRLGIGVVEHDRRIIAAQFKRDPLQAGGRGRHHLFAGRS